MNEETTGTGSVPAPGVGAIRAALAALFDALHLAPDASTLPTGQEDAERSLGRLPCPLHHFGAAHAVASLLFGPNVVPKPDDPRLESMIALMLARVFLETQSGPARLFLLLAGVIVHEDHSRRVSGAGPNLEKQERRQKGRIANLLSAMPEPERAALLAELEARAAGQDTAVSGDASHELAEMLTPSA